MPDIDGILLLYDYPIYVLTANTISEHIDAFTQHSQFQVCAINTEYGFPEGLNDLHFKAIVIHYSTFRTSSMGFFKKYLENEKGAYKIAFFQDEHHNCSYRFEFINQFKIDCIFSLIEPQYFKDTYEKYTRVKKIVYCIPGYVSENLIENSKKYGIPDELRTIDIGYRGRSLSYYMGRGAQEKSEIGENFLLRSKNLNLRLDIHGKENSRLYGSKWYKFLANSRGTLGVESGASIFDIDDSLTTKYYTFANVKTYAELLKFESTISFEDVARKLDFDKYENKIPYRMISPRHFEAAAFRVCQILYEGNYSGILKPMVHYIPLKKDFSNFEEVIQFFNDANIRHQLTDNAFNDLIASKKYSYERFIQEFDNILLEEGIKPSADLTIKMNADLYLKRAKKLAIKRQRFVIRIRNLIRRGLQLVIRDVYYIFARYNFHPGKFIPLRIRTHIDSKISRIL